LLTQADWLELLDLVERSLHYNGLQPETLNAGAFIHVRLYEHDKSAAHLAQATQLIRRAIRQTDRSLHSPCGSSEEDRGNLSDYYDTLRDVQELGGDLTGALETARTALAVLDPEDDDVGKRTDEITRIQALVPAGR
jgi:hypothetical protein